MACTFLLAVHFDRDRNLLNSLSLSAWSLLLLDPFWLFDPGFELSFLAVLAIAVVALPWLRQVTATLARRASAPSGCRLGCPLPASYRGSPNLVAPQARRSSGLGAMGPLASEQPVRAHLTRTLLAVGELLVVSFGIQLVFVVLMAIFFHRVSLIAPFLNLLAVPLVGVLVPLGFLLLSLSFLGLPTDLVAGKLCGSLIHVLLRAAEHLLGR